MDIFYDIAKLSKEQVYNRWVALMDHLAFIRDSMHNQAVVDRETRLNFDACLHSFLCGMLYRHVHDRTPDEIAYCVGSVMEALSKRLARNEKCIINFTISTEEFREKGESNGIGNG